MDEFETVKANESIEAAAPAPRWTGVTYIAVAQQLNQQWIELLCQLAANSSYRELPLCVLQNRDLWCVLDSEARKRVAALPFVIVDLRFKDIGWWRQVIERLSMTPADSTPFADLALETLLFARQAAREDITVAKTMFAMTPSVAHVIASLTMSQVKVLAAAQARHLRVRWDQDGEFWGDLLLACRSADEESIDALRRHAKLLFCGELVHDR